MSSYGVSQLLEKMKHADQDFRFMALQDLQSELRKSTFSMDSSTEERTVDQVLALMKDNNTEVKNHAVKTIGVLSTRVQEARLVTMIDQLTVYTSDKDEQLRDIANLGLRTVIRDVPVDAKFGELVCNNLAPRLLDQLNSSSASPDAQLGCTELLADLFARFEPYVRAQAELQKKSVKALTPLLKNARAAVRKRAVDALGFLTASSSDDVISKLISQTVVPELGAGTDVERLKTGIGLVGAMAGRAPQKIGPRLHELLPKVLKATSALDDDDLREAGLQALERVVLKCPREAAPFLQQIMDLATTLIKHDPNYAGVDGEDEEMNGIDEDEEDDDFEADYEDDDDVSWKVRRSATKVFAAIIETRPELLSMLFRTVSPVLISRFSEREESVRIEIWQTYSKLLQLAKVYGEVPPVPESASTLKRKRDDGPMRASPMDVDESPIIMLRQQTPSLLNALMKQLSHKSQPARLAGFALLRNLVDILHGGIEDHVSILLARTDAAFATADTGASGSATALKIEILAFLEHFFTLHPVSTYESHLAKSIVPRLTTAMNDKYNKVAAEAFSAAASLVRELRPVPPQDAIPDTIATALRSVYDATITRLTPGAVTDQDVRESALTCLGELLYHAGDALAPDFERSLGLLRAAIQRETTRLAAVRVTGHIAQSPTCTSNEQFSAWVQETLADVAGLLRQISRPIRVEAFAALPHLISAAGSALDNDSAATILSAVQPYLSEDDAYLIPSALGVTTALLAAQPSVAKSAVFKDEILPRSHALAKSPIVHGAALEALLHFFQALVQAGVNSKKLSDDLIAAGQTAASGETKPAYSTVARCLGAVVSQDPKLASPTAKALVKQLDSKKPSVFSLLGLGHIGRFPQLPEREKAFQKAHALFTASAEDVRLAAAFAVGNLAVGEPEQFLPILVQHIQTKAGDDRSRTLALNAVKEFIVHSSAAVLAPSADALWEPLISICAVDGPPPVEPKAANITPEDSKARDKRVDEAWKANEPIREQWKVTEVSRTMAAECLGKITLANPQRYLPKLQSRLQDKSAGIRAAAVSSVRFTFTDDSTALDDLLAAAFVSFMSLMRDVDLDVRRLTLNTLNSAAHHKPQLVRPHLPALLPMLLGEMAVDQSLIRIVEMGPFKHKVDDGLDVRKAAYETSYTLLDTCLSKLDTHELLSRIITGMTDDNEIRAISYLMLMRLAAVAPTTVVQRLDSMAEIFGKTFSEEIKSDSLKQEHEKLSAMKRAALRAFATLSKVASPASAPKFHAEVLKIQSNKDFGHEFKTLRNEVTINGADADAMQVD